MSERGERHEEQHELDERDGGAREVLDAVAAGEHVAGPGHREGEDAEHDGEDLRPARAEGEDQLLPREQTQVLRPGGRGRGGRAPPGATHAEPLITRPRSRPEELAAETGWPVLASGSWSREAASAWAITCEPIGVSSPGTRV